MEKIMKHPIRSTMTILACLMFCHVSFAQWQWNSDHIDQDQALTRAYQLIEEAYDNFSLIENPEYIVKPPHSHQEISSTLSKINDMLNDDLIATSEEFYQPAINQITKKLNDRAPRVEYSVGEILIMKMKAGDQSAISQAKNILSWGLLNIPPLFDPKLNKQYQSLIKRLEIALD